LREQCGKSAKCKLCKTLIKNSRRIHKGIARTFKTSSRDVKAKNWRGCNRPFVSGSTCIQAFRRPYIAVAGHRPTPGMMTGAMLTLCIMPGCPGISGIAASIPRFPGIKKPSREWIPYSQVFCGLRFALLPHFSPGSQLGLLVSSLVASAHFQWLLLTVPQCS